MDSIIKKLENFRVVPVVNIDEAKDALSLGKALVKGGLPIIEVTFRTAAAAETIARLRVRSEIRHRAEQREKPGGATWSRG